MRLTQALGVIFFLLAAGCAGTAPTPPSEVPKRSVAEGGAVAVAPAPAVRPPEAAASTPEGRPAQPTAPVPMSPGAGTAEKPVIRSETPAAPAPAAKVEAPATKPEAPVARSEPPAPRTEAPVGTPEVPKAPKPETPNVRPAAKAPAVPAPAPAKPAPPPALDLASLEKRLKETSAIGVFTKLTLKNQVDDLLNQFRAFYQGRRKTTLANLRQPYDLLILKVLTLLQDSDPSLAREIRESREAIWAILSNPGEFSKLQS